jgi:hypothetical protein
MTKANFFSKLSSFIDWCCYYTQVSYTDSWEPLVLFQLVNCFESFLVSLSVNLIKFRSLPCSPLYWYVVTSEIWWNAVMGAMWVALCYCPMTTEIRRLWKSYNLELNSFVCCEQSGKGDNMYNISLNIHDIGSLSCDQLHDFLRSPTYRGPSWSWSYGIWINDYLCNRCLSPLMLWVRIPLRLGVLNTTLCNKVCLWLVRGQWFSLVNPVSSTNKLTAMI